MLQKRVGFSLVEVTIWITILGIIFGLVIRGGFKKPPLDHFPYFIKELNNAVFFSQQEAVLGGKIFKLKILPLLDGGCKLELFEFNFQDNGESWVLHKSFLSPVNLVLNSKIVVSFSPRNEVVSVHKATNGSEKMGVDEGAFVTYFFPSGFCEKLFLQLSLNEDGFVKKEELFLDPFLCRFETIEEGL